MRLARVPANQKYLACSLRLIKLRNGRAAFTLGFVKGFFCMKRVRNKKINSPNSDNFFLFATDTFFLSCVKSLFWLISGYRRHDNRGTAETVSK